MKFLIISQNAGSNKHGMVLRNYNWAKTLVDMGHDVTIAATSFSHSRLRQPRTGHDTIDGIHYKWLWGPRYSATSAVGRVLSMFVFFIQLYLPYKFLRGRYDVIVCSSPPPFTIYPANRLADRNKAPLIFDVRDLWPLTLKELGGISNKHPFVQLMQRAEDFACRHADLVTAVPTGAEDYLKSHGLSAGKFMPMRNAVLDTPDKNPSPLSEGLKNTLTNIRAKASLVIGYTGALGTANAMDSLIEAAEKSDKDIYFVLIGDGPHRQKLEDQAAKLKISKRCHFLGTVSSSQIPACLSYFDVAYIGFLESPLYRYGSSPTKLNDYMKAAKPVLYSGNEDRNVIEISGGGLCVPAADPTSIVTAIESFKKMSPTERQTMGEQGKAWLIENNTVKAQMQKLLKKIKGLNR